MNKFQWRANTTIIRLLFSAIGFILLSQVIACRDEGGEILGEPVEGELIADFPRIGITSDGLSEFKNAKVNTEQWSNLMARMNSMISTGHAEYGFGAFHFAMAYAVTSESKFREQARQMIFRIIDEPGYCDVTSSYLRAPDCTGQVALAADLLFDNLSDAEKNKIFDYLETNARNIVEVNGWSGWGWREGNPEFRQLNNYYPGHLQTILHYALLAYNHRELARQYFDLVVKDELPAALDLMRTELKGGHGAEGTWYDDKLFGHYAEVVLMIREATHGKVDFGKEYSDVFADYVKLRLYSFNPLIEENGKPQLYHLATGDQPAVAGAMVIDLARLRLWLLMDVLKDTDHANAAGYVKYFEQTVTYETKGWQREFMLYYLLHFDQDVAPSDYTQELEHFYLSEGKGVAHYRTGWEHDALTATIHFSPAQGQRNSHWHFGEGAFYIWYKGWQADHLNRVEGSGIRQNTGLMNTLLVNNNEDSQGHGNAKVMFFAGNESFMAVKGDVTENYKESLGQFERTFIITDKVITVYDHVKKKSSADEVNFIITSESGFHTLPNEPGKFVTENGGGRLTVKPMMGDPSVTTEPMRMKVDFNLSANELDLLHAMEAGDQGTSSCTMMPIEPDGGSYFGVQYLNQSHAYVHLVNKTPGLKSSLTYTANFGSGPVDHVITGLEAGTYQVNNNAQPIAEVAVNKQGVLYFQSATGGTFAIARK